jgi:hypothetical protein
MIGAVGDPDVQLTGVYQLLAGISGAFIVIIVALGIALARTREEVSKLKEWTRVHEEWHKKERGE